MPTRPQLAHLISRIEDNYFIHETGGVEKERQKAKFPLWGTPKIDGRRCLKLGGRAYTRSMKLQENEHVQEQVGNLYLDGLDGELIVPDTGFNDGESFFKRYDAVGEFKYLIFDFCCPVWECMPHDERWVNLLQQLDQHPLPPWCELVRPVELNNMTELLSFDEKCLTAGFEGACYRHPAGLYKSGRSTLSQQWLLKRKPFEDADAVVIGFTPLMRNNNPQEVNELGLLKRSKRQENMVADDLLGTLQVRDTRTLEEFSIGTGFDTNTRIEIWRNQSAFLNQTLTYKYQKHGMKDKPRIPVFKGFRYDL